MLMVHHVRNTTVVPQEKEKAYLFFAFRSRDSRSCADDIVRLVYCDGTRCAAVVFRHCSVCLFNVPLLSCRVVCVFVLRTPPHPPEPIP